jgi:hypothetical protein
MFTIPHTPAPPHRRSDPVTYGDLAVALWNRTCRFHHQRGEHGGLASCTGVAPLGLLWRLGREGLAEWYRNERRLAPDQVPQ